MPEKSERIGLDAVLESVIDDSVFSAVLENGHRFVAVAKGRNGRPLAGVHLGDRVNVEFSPYDMSRGRVVAGPEQGNRSDESEKFGQENV